MILGRPVPGAKIVLVHPDAPRAEALARMLRAVGHRVSVVGEGRRVPQTIIEESPDLVLASLSFSEPPLDSALKAVRQALGPELPVVLIVGRENEDVQVEADEIIREPIDPGELELRVGSALRFQAERRLLQRKVDELLGLYKISWAFSIAAGPATLYGHLARQSAQLLHADKGLVLLFDSERRTMTAQPPGFGFTSDQVARTRYPVDSEARSRWNFRKNGPLVSNTPRTDTRLLSAMATDLDLHSVVLAPVVRGPQVTGLILVADRRPDNHFGDDELNLLLAVAGEASVAVENLKLHEEIKRANTLLQEYDRLKSEFVAMVAHDFRKPLMAIRGFSELVLEEPDIPAETRQEFMRTVISETEGLARLAEDTLLITQIETGEFEYRFSEIDLGPFVLETVPFGLSDHSILMDIPPELPKLIADPDRLRQVVNNLTTNAIKYSPAGGSITVRCRERGTQHLVLEVVDHGLGIPADQIPGLFQKFHRVRSEAHNRIAGTGLGLYICKLIVEGHGGQMWVESEMGKGSTFGLVLPLDARSARSQAKAAAEARKEER